MWQQSETSLAARRGRSFAEVVIEGGGSGKAAGGRSEGLRRAHPAIFGDAPPGTARLFPRRTGQTAAGGGVLPAGQTNGGF